MALPVSARTASLRYHDLPCVDRSEEYESLRITRWLVGDIAKLIFIGLALPCKLVAT